MTILAVPLRVGSCAPAFERMVAQVCLGKVGAVAAREVSRFARNSRDWHAGWSIRC
jgi:DNA invertase Pin-like site-specific DNA recombinase